MEITKDWIKTTKGKKGDVIEKPSYIVNGTAYVVDGGACHIKTVKARKEDC